MNDSRIKTVYLNSFITLVGQIVQVALSFILRKLFINYIGIEFLGYNSVFQNILQALNLVDLGIDVAITSFLYKPLAEKDLTKIHSIMFIYKHFYRWCGLLVLLFGIIVSLFLNVIIPDATCRELYLRILFYIHLMQTVSTYYIAYKRTLMIADQKSYVIIIIDTLSNIIITVIQIVIMVFFPSYVVYLVILVSKTIVSNIIISYKCNKLYFGQGDFINKEYIKEVKKPLYRYLNDLVISRLGAYIYYGTDNLIISVFKGSMITGYLSNYVMITSQINSVVSMVLESVQSTFGNFIVLTKEKKRQIEMVDNYLCINYCIGLFCMICILFLIQPFLTIYIGEEYLLANSTVFCLSINLLLSIMIQIPSQIFMIYKLYKYDKPIIFSSACLNIVISILLLRIVGIDGVLIGTTVTSCFYMLSRFYIISKYVFYNSYKDYIFKFIKYGFYTIISILLESILCNGILVETFFEFIIRALLVTISVIIFILIFICVSKEYNFIINMFIPVKLRKITNKRNILIFSATFLTIIMVLKCFVCNDGT